MRSISLFADMFSILAIAFVDCRLDYDYDYDAIVISYSLFLYASCVCVCFFCSCLFFLKLKQPIRSFSFILCEMVTRMLCEHYSSVAAYFIEIESFFDRIFFVVPLSYRSTFVIQAKYAMKFESIYMLD